MSVPPLSRAQVSALILVLRNGIPVDLDPRIEDMVLALLESQEKIVQHRSGCVELHYGIGGTDAKITGALGRFKAKG